MKKSAKIWMITGFVVMLLGAFLWSSVNDIVRLNDALEGVERAELASTAKIATFQSTVSVLIPADELPEEVSRTNEVTAEWNADGLETASVNNVEYTITPYVMFTACGGKFDTDKYGDLKVTEIDGVAYNMGSVMETRIVWDNLNGYERAMLVLNGCFMPLLIVGAVVFIIGWVLRLKQVSAAENISVARYLGRSFEPKRIWKVISNNIIVVGIILLAVVVTIMRPNFISESNFRNLLSNTAIRFIIAVGVSGCLITKGTDLSAGRVTGFAACVSAILLQRAGDYASKFYPSLGELPIIPVLMLVLVICAVIGAMNGVIIATLKVPPFIATLGMQTLVYGICLVYTGAQSIGNLQTAYTNIALGYVGNRVFSYIALIALAVGIYMWFLYNKMRHGKYMYAIGGNENAAEVAGINTTSVKIRIYTLAAILYGLTGFLMAAKSGGASVNTAQGYELEAIAGCTIGGVSVNGGVGSIGGIVIGVLVFELLKIALQFMGVESSYTYIAQGLVIIIAVALDLRKYLARK